MPNHSASSRHATRWAVGVAVLAVAALVLDPAAGRGAQWRPGRAGGGDNGGRVPDPGADDADPAADPRP